MLQFVLMYWTINREKVVYLKYVHRQLHMCYSGRTPDCFINLTVFGLFFKSYHCYILQSEINTFVFLEVRHSTDFFFIIVKQFELLSAVFKISEMLFVFEFTVAKDVLMVDKYLD